MPTSALTSIPFGPWWSKTYQRCETTWYGYSAEWCDRLSVRATDGCRVSGCYINTIQHVAFHRQPVLFAEHLAACGGLRGTQTVPVAIARSVPTGPPTCPSAPRSNGCWQPRPLAVLAVLTVDRARASAIMKAQNSKNSKNSKVPWAIRVTEPGVRTQPIRLRKAPDSSPPNTVGMERNVVRQCSGSGQTNG